MTVTPTRPPSHRARVGSRRPALAVAWVLAGAAVLVQMAFPFTDGGNLPLTTASVVLLTGAALVHAGAVHGPRAALVLLGAAGGVGLVAEAIGVRTGLPFGSYDYTGTLGLEVLGVPALVPLAWVMIAWPALVVARTLVPRRGPWRVVVGAWALTAWDVFLDPQMVDLGHWAWDNPSPTLPGVDGIPLTNFAGWLLVSAVLVAVLDLLVPTAPDPRDDLLPAAVYLWTYFSSVLAHAAFFGRPPVALVGAVVMGLTAVPLLVVLLRRRTAP